jgi:phage terminase large subunit-like protein
VEAVKELKTGRGVFNRYCRDVAGGGAPACGLVKKAVERCLRDFERIKDGEFEYEFDWNICEKFYNFSRTIPLPDRDGFLPLLPWQVFCLFNLIGWVSKNNAGKRRFRSGLIQVPRKNGKTTGLMYPLLIWDFITSGSAESYFFEKDEPQARKVYKELQAVLSRHELLKDRIDGNIFAIYSGNKRIAYFTSESMGIDGYRPSLAVIDEYWCFPSDKPLTAMRYGGRSRDSSLALIITTAGTDISLPCYDETLKAKKILNGVSEQDDYFCVIYTIDEEVKWNTKEAYIMANPSLKDKEGRGIIDPKLLEQDLRDAVNQPSHKPDYLAKTLNVWTVGSSSWIPIEKCRFSGGVDFSLFGERKHPCYGALDLSAVNDWTAYTLCFNKDDVFYFKHRFYIPSATVDERYRKENINILKWIDRGLVTVIESETIDYTYIFNDIKKDYEAFDIREIAYDNWGSRDLINAVTDAMPKIDVFSFGQSLKYIGQPTKELEKRILDRKIETDCKEIIIWMLGNVQIKPDPNGNYKPLKNYASSSGRIDGVITMIMSLDRCLANKAGTRGVSFQDILNLF